MKKKKKKKKSSKQLKKLYEIHDHTARAMINYEKLLKMPGITAVDKKNVLSGMVVFLIKQAFDTPLECLEMFEFCKDEYKREYKIK